MNLKVPQVSRVIGVLVRSIGMGADIGVLVTTVTTALHAGNLPGGSIKSPLYNPFKGSLPKEDLISWVISRHLNSRYKVHNRRNKSGATIYREFIGQTRVLHLHCSALFQLWKKGQKFCWNSIKYISRTCYLYGTTCQSKTAVLGIWFWARAFEAFFNMTFS